MRADSEPREVVERRADSKGRVTIGAEYAGELVRVAVLEREGAPTQKDLQRVVDELRSEGADETAREVAEIVGLDVAASNGADCGTGEQ